jgi:hypothetical protein
MALVGTTLARAHTILNGEDAKRITLTTATGATTQMIGYMDTLECFRIVDVSNSPTLGIVPGYTASTAGPHNIGAPVVFGVPSDFVNIGGPMSLDFNVSGAITGPGGVGTLPVVDTIIFLTATGVGVYTIAAPAVDANNTLTFIATTAQAHTLTMTGNPAANDVATWTAGIGNSLTIRATNGSWSPIASSGVTVA